MPVLWALPSIPRLSTFRLSTRPPRPTGTDSVRTTTETATAVFLTFFVLVSSWTFDAFALWDVVCFYAFVRWDIFGGVGCGAGGQGFR